MRIVYDGAMLRWGSGGIARYFGEIISRLPSDWSPTVLGLENGTHSALSHPNLRISTRRAVRPRPVRVQWWKLKYLGRAGLLHPTYYSLSGGLRYKDVKCPVVITVYDLIYARYPHLIPDSEVVLRWLREAILRADHIVCISKATESDLLELFPETSGKTSVVHLGSSFSPRDVPKAPASCEPPTFLFVGGRGGYKNYHLLLRAFAKASQVHREIRLHVAGPPLSSEELWQMHFLGISDRVDQSVYPSDEALRMLYQKSLALLYPSRYEGFGIPALEAMACGTVAVTSNTTSLPEVVGDAGIMLDPADEDAWAECIVQIANGGGDRARLLQKGRDRVAQFSWDETARKHLEIYHRVACS